MSDSSESDVLSLGEENLSNSSGEESSTNVYVTNLNSWVNDDWLYQIFSPYGVIVSAKAVITNGKCKGYGFVQYKDSHCAWNAVHMVNGTNVNNKRLWPIVIKIKAILDHPVTHYLLVIFLRIVISHNLGKYLKDFKF
eukprot:NODE_1921_length_1751_cov_16.397420_g1633_i0.p1 GENE.NODE_1921_length_1751_cov_16.397420_g1633_i0~~NODE_1921_length_1751_cov_16.397420_g1633_i0.p1  ORF type:complete len:154 (+),score=17.85 NODE_1921_length_1751_cov_16.397420_g1633_i0:51-464(+)